MAVDGSFKKEGAIPFKWEIRPGVPKVLRKDQQLKEQKSQNKALPETPTKLAPPPAARFQLQPKLKEEPRARSFLSAPRLLSQRYASDVVPAACLPSSPLLTKIYTDNKKKVQKDKHKLKVQPESEPDSYSYPESPWSLSSRRKFSSSPLLDSSSPLSSSFSSHRSSPRPINHSEWATYGLF